MVASDYSAWLVLCYCIQGLAGGLLLSKVLSWWFVAD